MQKRWYAIIATILALVVLVPMAMPVMAAGERIADTDTTSVRKLMLDAPDVVRINQMVSMTVTERGSGDNVKDAGIWAFTRENAQALRQAIASIKEQTVDAARPLIDWESLLNRFGEFLGYTNGAGKLHHTFDEAGGYLLIAFKDGFRPGIDRIAVRGAGGNALALDAPDVVRINQMVSMTVTERGSGDNVKDAGIWAFTRENAQALRQAIASIKEQTVDAARPLIDWESLLNRFGEFLGYTNGAGKLHHTFDEAGGYLLIAFKDGFRPGIDRIAVRGAEAPVITPATVDAVRI